MRFAAERRGLQLEPTGTPQTFRATLPANLAYFDGHFDGFPLLPAVVQLSQIVLPLIRQEYPDLGDVHQLRRVRFRKPLTPNASITVGLSRSGLRVTFEIQLPTELAASGTLQFRP